MKHISNPRKVSSMTLTNLQMIHRARVVNRMLCPQVMLMGKLNRSLGAAAK